MKARTMPRNAMTVLPFLLLGLPAFAAPPICEGFGPQTPRDIADRFGRNNSHFNMAPPASDMNLCNIHTHTNAEHKGPGFSVYAGAGEHGGYKCNETASLTQSELSAPMGSHANPAQDGHETGHKNQKRSGFSGVKPGDTIEVHWVFSSCDVFPGPGLGSCSIPDVCLNPQLRVESQVFLVVNDPNALDFNSFTYGGIAKNGRHQPRTLPDRSGTPVQFAGSTTGTSYDNDTCSPLQVTWSVRPACMKIDINSLNRWADRGNPFYETHSHGVRELVTNPDLLAPIR